MQQDSTDPTGVRDETPRGNKEIARARNRKANAAIQLRVYGASWEEIAVALGFPTARTALVATEKALEKELQTPESQAFMRKIGSEQYAKLLKAVMPRATGGDQYTDKDGNPAPNPEHLLYVDRALKIMAAHERLNGYAAPQTFVVSNPTLSEIEAWVGKVMQSDVPEVEEADIFGGDVVTPEGEVVSSGNEGTDAVPA